MPCPEMFDFSAWINLMPPGPSNLIVVGKVVTTAGNLQPKLTERSPQGINDKILDLTIEQMGDVGTADVGPRDVRFEKSAGQGQYDAVEIYFEGALCKSLDVRETH